MWSRLVGTKNDPRAMRVVERGRRLVEPADGGGERDRLAGAQAVGDGAAGQVLHDDERRPLVLADVVDRHDIGMHRHAGGGPPLALKALAGAGIGRDGGREDLDRVADHGAAGAQPGG